jgi:long-chain acyl-CoA synthetase
MAGGSGGRRFPPGTRVHASGSRVPARLRQSFRTDAGTQLHISYGAREIGRISTTYPEGGDDELESVGIPVPSIELQIVDDDGHPLPTGERGEIRVRSAGMIREYHLDPAATSRHFRDGWFHPGDVGSLTPGGSLCIHGRFDDMMSLNSIKIFPAEIERVLEEHPAVRAAAAFGIRSAVHGDIPVAAVELYAPAQAGPDELLTLARQRLGVRAPRRIFVLDALPRNATGKIVRRELSGRYGRGA